MLQLLSIKVASWLIRRLECLATRRSCHRATSAHNASPDVPEGVTPGQEGVQTWDLPGIGRIAILICFDINFFELWHQAYASGAQVVFCLGDANPGP